MNTDRRSYYQELEKLRDSRVLVYVTGDRRNMETKISSEVLNLFVHHLDTIQNSKKISLYLYTRGGDTLAAWSIANLIRQFCDELEVIVPYVAHSAGTLICLSANKIVMTKQASLGPIDPSVNTPLNPSIPGAPPDARMPVSVEAVTGYIEFAKGVLGEKGNAESALLALANNVHPLVLGTAFRARGQIRMLAAKLMANMGLDEEHREKLLEFLCSGSGSHDYTINREEAAEELGLPIEKPDSKLYSVIKSIHDDIATELDLLNPFDPRLFLGTDSEKHYNFPRALIESITGGADTFIAKGVLRKKQVPVAPGVARSAIEDERETEGWSHENGKS